jgi:hypothetical protein
MALNAKDNQVFDLNIFLTLLHGSFSAAQIDLNPHFSFTIKRFADVFPSDVVPLDEFNNEVDSLPPEGGSSSLRLEAD